MHKSLNTSLEHVAIIMDGNGRWAKERKRPRVWGHQKGALAVRKAVSQACLSKLKTLTLFAFSRDNWQRPEDEVNKLMSLFVKALENELKLLMKQNIRLKIIGDRFRLSTELCEKMEAVEFKTANNTQLTLYIAIDYSSKWEIIQACKQIGEAVQNNELTPDQLSEQIFENYLCTPDLPEIDLLIRTGGEQRLSDFMMWQLAYAELYFTDLYWPDFDELEFIKAIDYFYSKERRKGKTSEQITSTAGSEAE